MFLEQIYITGKFWDDKKYCCFCFHSETRAGRFAQQTSLKGKSLANIGAAERGGRKKKWALPHRCPLSIPSEVLHVRRSAFSAL